jgi:hypothetical protein
LFWFVDEALFSQMDRAVGTLIMAAKMTSVAASSLRVTASARRMRISRLPTAGLARPAAAAAPAHTTRAFLGWVPASHFRAVAAAVGTRAHHSRTRSIVTVVRAAAGGDDDKEGTFAEDAVNKKQQKKNKRRDTTSKERDARPTTAEYPAEFLDLGYPRIRKVFPDEPGFDPAQWDLICDVRSPSEYDEVGGCTSCPNPAAPP